MQDSAKIIKIVKGYELNIRVSSDIRDKHDLMYLSYCQALRALKEIIQQTRKFHDRDDRRGCDNRTEEALFCYNGNIITFEGERGSGKTQTMLSFANAIRDGKDICGDLVRDDKDRLLEDAKFRVMPPISPSVLEKKQNLLYVILSRLYDLAGKTLRKERCSGISERETIELSRLFNDCLSGINGIKRANDPDLELSAIQNISDGAALRMHFHKLVQRLIELDEARQGKNRTFLVLLLDDADSQIKNGYKVLDDIRKYLVIPNLVIVMSADADFLHKVIYQEHLEQFSDLRNMDSLLSEELSHLSRKYIDKLIPPSHMIHLPNIDQYAEMNAGSNLHLKYVRMMDGIEVPVFDWGKNLQGSLLMLLYKKTGLVLIPHSQRMHSIIPRTLRGLNQILYLLSSMEDAPPVENSFQWDEHSLALSLQRRLKILETNLEQFSSYFAGGWLKAKIRNKADQEFFKEFTLASGDDYVYLAMEYLENRYDFQLDDEENHRGRTDKSVTLDRYAKVAIKAHLNALEDDGQLTNTGKAYLSAIKQYIDVGEQSDNGLILDEGISVGLFSCMKVLEACGLSKEKQTALQELRELLTPQPMVRRNDPAEQISAPAWERRRMNSRIALDASIDEIAREYREKDDVLLLFGIRMFLSLESHRRIVRQKQVKIEEFLSRKSDTGESKLLVFDINPDTTCLPKTFRVGKDVAGFPVNYIMPPGSNRIVAKEDRRTAVTLETAHLKKIWERDLSPESVNGFRLIHDSMISLDENQKNSLNFMNFVTLLLRLGFDRDTLGPIEANLSEPVVKSYLERKDKSMTANRFLQGILYEMQEVALLISANWEVQEALRRRLKISDAVSTKDTARRTGSAYERLSMLYGKVDTVLREIIDDQVYKDIFGAEESSAWRMSYASGPLQNAFMMNKEIDKLFGTSFERYFIQCLFGGMGEDLDYKQYRRTGRRIVHGINEQ